MSTIIGVVSQKGGVGKSTVSRMVACEYARAGWNVKLADMDTSQSTSFKWQSRRLKNEITPTISVEQFNKVDQALKVADTYDLVVFDAPPHSTNGTLQIAKRSDLIIIPTGTSLDDLEPAFRLAKELQQEGISTSKITFLFNRVGDSLPELEEAFKYLRSAPFHVFSEYITDRTAYRRASDLGRALTETTHSSTNAKAALVMKQIVTWLDNISNKEAA